MGLWKNHVCPSLHSILYHPFAGRIIKCPNGPHHVIFGQILTWQLCEFEYVKANKFDVIILRSITYWFGANRSEQYLTHLCLLYDTGVATKCQAPNQHKVSQMGL